MIVVGSCYFLFTLLIPYDPNIDFVFPLNIVHCENNDSVLTSCAMSQIVMDIMLHKNTVSYY